MINTNVTNVLQQLNGITNSVVLKYPNTIINSPAGDIVASVDIKSLDSDEFSDIGIFDLGSFIKTLNLFNGDREVTITDTQTTIVQGNKCINYLNTNISLLEEFNKKESIFTNTKSVPVVGTFNLSSDDFKQFKQASSVFKDLSDIVIKSQDESITVKLQNSSSFNSSSNGYSVTLDAETSKEFTIKIPAENFNKLPVSDYTVNVHYNSSKDAYRVIMYSNDIEMSILLAVKK